MWVSHHHTGPLSVSRLWKEAHRSMNTRRDFLSVSFKGSAMAAASAFLSDSDPALAGSVSGRSVNRMEDTINNGSTRHYKPPFRFGRGGVPLGNEFAVVTDRDAYATLEAAWAAGVRYHDVAPLVWSWSGGEKSRQLPAHRILLSRIPAIPTS